MPNVVFTREHTADRGYTSYKAEGFPGVILLSKPAFNGEHPETISLNDVPEAIATAPKVKLTKEQRAEAAKVEKARLASLTPAQRAAEKASKANDKFLKAQERAKKAAAAAEKAAQTEAGA
jgi:hypothetical protein